MSKNPDIKYLFEPRSVAIVGASNNKKKIGYQIVENIYKGKFKGEVFPINPKGGEIHGYKVYKTAAEVPHEIDLAVISVPVVAVYAAMEDLIKRKVKFFNLFPKKAVYFIGISSLFNGKFGVFK